MESNNWNTDQTQVDQHPNNNNNNNVEAGDWRLNFSSESRRRVISKILESLKKHYPYPNDGSELNNVALKFERKTYSVATNQDDYLRKISLKLCAINNKNQNCRAGSVATIPASSSQSALDPVLQNMPIQRNNQDEAILMTSTVNQSESLQQMLVPDLPVSTASAGIQSSVSLASTLPSVSGTNQSPISNLINQSSNMQNMTGASQNALVNSIVNGVASNVFNNQKEVPGRQQVIPGRQQLYKNQQQPQQLMRQNRPQQIMQNPVLQSSIQQQQQQNLLQPNQMQSSQLAGNSKSNAVLQQHLQSMLRQQQQCPLQTLTQQRQQLTHQSTTLSQPQQQLQTSQPVQSLMGQQMNTTNMLDMRQQQQRLITQQMGHQGNTSGLQQQMQGTLSNNSDMNSNQQQMNWVHQNKVHVQLQNQQPATSLLTNQGHSQSPQLHVTSKMQSVSAQFPQNLGMNQQQLDAQQRLQPSGSSMQSHNIGDQQKQIYQQPRVLPAVSSVSTDSISQTGHPSSANWQEEVHTKITRLKDMYFTDLQNIYQQLSYRLQQVVSSPQQSNSDQLEKVNAYKSKVKELLAVLLVRKNNVTPAFGEKLPSIEKLILNVLNSQRQRRPDHGLRPMQSSQQAQSHENHSNTLLQSSNIQGSGMVEQNNRSLQQNSISSLPGASYEVVNMSGNLKPGPNVDVEQGSGLASLKKGVDGSLQQTNLNAFSVQNCVNVVQPNVSDLQSTRSVNKQHVQEQQAMQGQQLRNRIQQPHQQMLQKQQQPQQKSRDHQQAGLISAHQVPQLQKMDKANEGNIRQGFGAKIGTLSQSHGTAVGQPSVYHPQLKSGVSFPISSSQMLQTSSPRDFQTSSPGVDQQNMIVSVSKAGTPLRSANSPFTVPSPSTPLAPSPMQGDLEKNVSNVSPLTAAGKIRVQQSAISNAATQLLSIETSEISTSPLVAQLRNQEISHGNTSTAVTKSCITEEPLDRLIKAVKSISNEALAASVNDIGSVLSMIDGFAGSAPGKGSRAVVGEDLAALTKFRLQAEILESQDKISGSRKLKRCTSFMPSALLQTNGSSDYSLMQLVGSELSDSESTASSRAKRPRTEVNCFLLKEISDINQWLIDTVVTISKEDVNPSTTAEVASGGDRGVIVKCSYIAVALSPGLKSQYATTQLSPIQPLRLLVPSNYPKCSPVLLDDLPANMSNEKENLSMKAKSKLSQSLRTLSQPISVKEIASTWDLCTRAVISEYAQAMGGGSFSSRYGNWETVF